MIYISGVPNFERKVPNRYFGPVNCNPQAKRPFGFMAHNGLNFSRSVTDRNSRLARIVRYLQYRMVERVTRKDILRDVFNIREGDVRSPRGYNAYVFSLARKTGFIMSYRIGRQVFYELGPNSNKVSR